jgi:hypothetical protein
MYNGSGSLGKIDLLLWPYYERDTARGILTDEEAIFHLACLLVRDTGYSQLGGPDETGKDVTNRVSYLVLEAAHLDPTVINGGIVNAYGANTRLGAGAWMVVEADESDGSFLRLPALIGDHMVLQREQPVRIYGWASPGETISVRMAGQTVSAIADPSGRWEAWLRPMPAGGPYELAIAGRNTITVRDVLVGEVWVASGQSNMPWPVERSRDPEKEIAAANYPRIRLFKVALKTSEEPLDDVEGSWQPCRPESVKSFSAVAYFFGRHLQEKLGVPIGLIQSAWGGTPAQAWTSRATLVSEPSLQTYLVEWNRVLVNWPRARRRWAMRWRICWPRSAGR